jgi:hypothetical protein
VNDFDEQAAAASDRLRRRATELAAANPFDGGDGRRRPVDPDAPRDRRWIAVAAAAAVVVVGVVGIIAVTDDTPDVVTDSSGPPELITVPDTLPATIVTDPTTTADSMTTTLPADTSPPTTIAPQPLLRPIIDPAICAPIFAREGPTFEPIGPLTLFMRPSEFPVPIQIIGNADQGAVGPFAIVLRYLDNTRALVGDLVDVNGVAVGVATYPNGNGEATWNLPDGGQGYLRSRGLSREEIIAVLTTLTPRSADVPIPGFDYGDAGPPTLELLHEQMNTEVSEGSTSGSQCRIPGTSVGYSVSTLNGDPVYVFGGVIDRPAPLAVGEHNGTVLVIAGPDLPGAPTVDDVMDADETLWNELRTAEVLGGPRVEPIGGDLEVIADLVTFAGGDGGQLTFKLRESEGIAFLEVYTGNAKISADGVYWHIQIDGRTRLITTAGAGGTLGQRVGEVFPPEPFTAEVSIFDGDDLVLQTTGEIMLVPEP